MDIKILQLKTTLIKKLNGLKKGERENIKKYVREYNSDVLEYKISKYSLIEELYNLYQGGLNIQGTEPYSNYTLSFDIKFNILRENQFDLKIEIITYIDGDETTLIHTDEITNFILEQIKVKLDNNISELIKLKK